MPAYLLYILDILLFITVFLLGVFFVQQYLKTKKYLNRIHALEQEISTLKAQFVKEQEHAKHVASNSLYEKYAGLVLSHMDKAVILIDQNRQISLINNYARQFLDLTVSEGTSLRDALHLRAKSVTDSYAQFEDAFLGKAQSLPEETELVSTHGTFSIRGTIIPLMGGDQIVAAALIFEDNSKQVERVKEELAFFSAAAHELRTPLTVIRMTIALLLEKFDVMSRDKILEHLRRSDETSERLVRLINDFLNVSRVDQGRLDMNTESFDMIALIDTVIENFSLIVKKKNLYIKHEKDVVQRTVVGDKTKAAEVLSNLINNGLKYSVQGGVTITHEVSDSKLETIIRDTGVGIPKESQRLLFKRFGQVGDSNNHEAGKSTGLGLYISKKLAQLMRGDVVLRDSKPGVGSTFVFMLPLG